ncbi:hypothetical protein HUJ05_003430 [Dendroctonus ponderosae]|nr:hypothetical protein HUJ05_003430 [Dendroctonus ponderosae]
MLLYFVRISQAIEEVIITYLAAGHTYMPVDSVHAVIEKYVSKLNVQAPSEWIVHCTLLRNAWRKPKLYEVIPVRFEQFLDWKSMASNKKIKGVDGYEIKVTDIRRASVSKTDLNSLYLTTKLPIKKNKLKDLRNLCDKLVIQKPYHVEYLTLSSHGTNVPEDVLPETDVIWVCGRIFVAFELKFGAHLAFGPSKENVYFKSPPSKWTSFRKTKSMSVLMYVRNVTSGYV